QDPANKSLPSGSLYAWFTRQGIDSAIVDADDRISALKEQIAKLNNSTDDEAARKNLERSIDEYQKWQQVLPKAKDIANFIKASQTTLPKAEVAAARMYYEIEIDGEPRRIYVIDYWRGN